MSELKSVLTTQSISASVERAVERELAKIPPEGKHMAEVAIEFQRGINLAYAYSTGREWKIGVYVGKHWEGPVEGGAFVKWVK
jgi:hypothetical protein